MKLYSVQTVVARGKIAELETEKEHAEPGELIRIGYQYVRLGEDVFTDRRDAIAAGRMKLEKRIASVDKQALALRKRLEKFNSGV